jgi:hypothetical protein
VTGEKRMSADMILAQSGVLIDGYKSQMVKEKALSFSTKRFFQGLFRDP